VLPDCSRWTDKERLQKRSTVPCWECDRPPSVWAAGTQTRIRNTRRQMVAHLRVTFTFRCGQLHNELSAQNKLYWPNWQNVNVGSGISGRQNLVFVWPSLTTVNTSYWPVTVCTSRLLTLKKLCILPIRCSYAFHLTLSNIISFILYIPL